MSYEKSIYNLLRRWFIVEENQFIEALKTFGVASSSLQCPACNKILTINRDKTKMNSFRFFVKNAKKDFILGGSTTFSDKWGAYEKYFRDNQEFEHRSVNHSVEFVSSLDPVVHTQTIERLWSHLKNIYKKRSLRRRKSIELYLPEFLIRKINNYDNEVMKFEKLINILFSK